MDSVLGWEILHMCGWSLAVQRDLLCVQKTKLFNMIFNCSSPGSLFTFEKGFDLPRHLFGLSPLTHLLIANAAIPLLWSSVQNGLPST